MLGVAMKTYIRDIDMKEKRVALLTDRVNTNLSQWKEVKKKKLSEPWCKCSLI